MIRYIVFLVQVQITIIPAVICCTSSTSNLAATGHVLLVMVHSLKLMSNGTNAFMGDRLHANPFQLLDLVEYQMVRVGGHWTDSILVLTKDSRPPPLSNHCTAELSSLV